MAHRYAAGDESPVTPQNAHTRDIPSPYATAAMKLRDNDENDASFTRGGNTSSSKPPPPLSTMTAADAVSPVPMDSIWNVDHVSVKTSALSGSVRALSDVSGYHKPTPTNIPVASGAPAQTAPPTYAPKGVDEHSYLLGQNDALLAAFEGALPQRQLLGALQLALADVRAHVGRLETARDGANENVARLGARIGTLGGRSRVLENNIRDLTLSTLPAIEHQIGALQARMDVAERRRSMSWRELLTEAAKTAFVGVSTKVSDAERVAGACARQFLFSTDGCLTNGERVLDERRSALEKNIGALMFVAVTEAMCAANAAANAKLPARFHNRVTATFTKGLEISRAIVWASVFVHGASSIKDETARAASMLFEAFGASPCVANDDISDDADDITHDIDAIVAP